MSALIDNPPDGPPESAGRKDAESAPLLQVEDLQVEYFADEGVVKAVDGVSFTLRAGESLGLAGESGSGKSTIVQSILRLAQAPAIITGGRALFRGRDLLEMGENELRAVRWRDISLVCQAAMNALNPVLRVGEQLVDLFRAHPTSSQGKKHNPSNSLDRAAELLELVGIPSNRLSSFPHELSGGMRQRVIIAMALALEAPLVVMDEPTTALDVVVQRDILDQLSALRQKLDFSVIFITHDLSVMRDFCSHIAVLYGGRVMELAPTSELFSAPKHPYTRGLLDSIPSASGPRRALEGIQGTPYDARHPVPGCPFQPRCPEAIEICHQRTPTLVQLGDRHRWACHHTP